MKESDCLMVVVMTHGSDEQVLSSKDYDYKSNILWKYFTESYCPILKGKPKIFILQVFSYIIMYSK